jgi:hypothetical protein
MCSAAKIPFPRVLLAGTGGDNPTRLRTLLNGLCPMRWMLEDKPGFGKTTSGAPIRLVFVTRDHHFGIYNCLDQSHFLSASKAVRHCLPLAKPQVHALPDFSRPRRSHRIEDEPVLGLTASWTLKRLTFVTRHHEGYVRHGFEQNHIFAARQATHRSLARQLLHNRNTRSDGYRVLFPHLSRYSLISAVFVHFLRRRCRRVTPG